MEKFIYSEWTILIYANGNNELEPEMWLSILEIGNSYIENNHTQVIIQISREDHNLIKKIRSHDPLSESDDYWIGTRRYVLENKELKLVEVLPQLNMAHPNTLYDFIAWGVENFPSKKYALSLGGHIYQLVGMLPDYSQSSPYLMGFPEIAYVIQNACSNLNISIDILVLDTCYASSIEIIYEFGQYDFKPIKYILTYAEKASLHGLIYSNMCKILDENYNLETEELLSILLSALYKDNTLYPLIVINLDLELLKKCKLAFNNIAYNYINNTHCSPNILTPYELLTNYDPNFPWSKQIIVINLLFKKLIFSYNSIDDDEYVHIHVLDKYIEDDNNKKLYYRLNFAKDSYWFNYVTGLKEHNYDNNSDNLTPITMSKNNLFALISNTNNNLDEVKTKSMLLELLSIKKWDIR